MSRKKTIIEDLTDTDFTMLNEGWKNGKSHVFRNRCQCILMSHQGHDVKELSKMFSVRTRTIYTWLNNWRKIGIMGLITKPGQGRKPNISIDNKEHVKVLEKAAKNAAEKGTNMLEEVVDKLEIKQGISQRTLRRALKKKLWLQETS